MVHGVLCKQLIHFVHMDVYNIQSNNSIKYWSANKKRLFRGHWWSRVMVQEWKTPYFIRIFQDETCIEFYASVSSDINVVHIKLKSSLFWFLVYLQILFLIIQQTTKKYSSCQNHNGAQHINNKEPVRTIRKQINVTQEGQNNDSGIMINSQGVNNRIMRKDEVLIEA